MTAAMAGLLLVYGFAFAMEGMTTRIPSAAFRELITVTSWMLPWMLLYCSGLEDLVTVTRRAAVFWLGVALVLCFLYYHEGHTGDGGITKIVMPFLVALGGSLPHVVRRLRFLFTAFSLIAGIAGLVVLYFSVSTLFSGGSFATRSIGTVIVSFEIAAVATSGLSVAFLLARQTKTA